jgi:hypothetical protein
MGMGVIHRGAVDAARFRAGLEIEVDHQVKQERFTERN